MLLGVTVALAVWSAILSATSQGGLEAIVVTIITLSFAAFSVPKIIIDSRRQRRGLEPGDASDGAGEFEAHALPRRVTRIGWIALVLSLAAPALFAAMTWGFLDGLEYASQPEGHLGALIWPYLILAWLLDVLAAAVVCTIAGTRGRGNRTIGVVGGLLLLSPIAYVVIGSVIESIQYS